MRNSLHRTAVVALLLCGAATTHAQTAAPEGSISGHVFCGDSKLPARFGRVLLKSVQPGGFGDDFTKRLEKMTQAASKPGQEPPKPPTEEQKKAQVAASRMMNHAADLINGSTIGMNGEYSFAHVKPGTYYVHAMFPGYVDPLTMFWDDDLASTDPAVRARIAAVVPMVTIAGADTARQDLRLERGASVTGRVLFDDGSPASGWVVKMIQPKAAGDGFDSVLNAAMAQSMIAEGTAVKTDDRGEYRIAGLAPGDYAVQATMTATDIGVSATNMAESGSGINLTVFSNGTFKRADAKAIKLTAGEDRAGVDVNVPSHKLHPIVGHVYAKTDGHPVNYGQVSLADKNDASFHARGAIRDDGSFHFEYLPPGVYTVNVESAADAHTTGSTSMMGMSIPKQDILRKYGADSTEVTLGDSDSDSARLTVAETDWKPPVKKPGKEASPGAALGGLLGGLLSGDDDDAPKTPAPTPAH